MLDNALPSFVHPAAHLYAPPLIYTLCRSFIHSTTHLYTLPLIYTLHHSFIHSAAHLYAPPLIYTLCRSFICSTAHSYTPLLIHMLPFASAFILMPHHHFVFMCIFARLCPLQLAHICVHICMLCSHMHPWALHPHLGPSVCMKELLWSITTQGRHYKQTSPWVSFAPPHPLATSQCMQMNFCGWSFHAAVHVMGEMGSKD